MKAHTDRRRSITHALVSLAVAAAVYQGISLSGVFPQVLLPTIQTILHRLLVMMVNGVMLNDAGATLYRVLVGFGLAIAVGLPLGILMARFRPIEHFFLPLISALMPIPSFSLVPLFMLWFGIGDLTTILVVFYAATFPILFNVWSGVRAVNPIWLRAAIVMGADEATLFRKVIWPGALPYIITGLRLSFGRAWIGVIGGELLASPKLGLGEIIFNAKEFLNSGVMLATLVAIGVIGVFFERFVFQTLENVTVRRWGMVAETRS